MKIIVGGCGNIGENLLFSLVGEGHDVVVLDSSAEVITEMTNIYDVMGVGYCEGNYALLFGDDEDSYESDPFIFAKGEESEYDSVMGYINDLIDAEILEEIPEESDEDLDAE